MKLVYTELEKQLVFQENKVNVLVIERKELFRRMIKELDNIIVPMLHEILHDLFYLIIIKQ